MLWLAALALLTIVALGFGELLARWWRLDDFPLYQIGGPEGYRMAPDQSGKLRGRIAWRYDRFGMRSDEDPRSLAGRVLLLGDSVVDGGTMASQDDTVMAHLARHLGRAPYPVACHGWSLHNGLAALEGFPDWETAAWLVCVVNPGDFDTIGRAESQFSFPIRRPKLLAPWLVWRLLYRRRARLRPRAMRRLVLAEDPHLRAHLFARFAAIAERFTGRILFVYVPMQPDQASQAEFFRLLAGSVRDCLAIDAGQQDGWGPSCYADHVHPNAAGRAELARMIAHTIATEQRAKPEPRP
jgi:hypothetical protein